MEQTNDIDTNQVALFTLCNRVRRVRWALIFTDNFAIQNYINTVAGNGNVTEVKEWISW